MPPHAFGIFLYLRIALSRNRSRLTTWIEMDQTPLSMAEAGALVLGSNFYDQVSSPRDPSLFHGSTRAQPEKCFMVPLIIWNSSS